MTLSEVLGLIRGGAKARRASWHDGLLYVHVPGKDGFAEPVLKYRQGGHVLDQPYPPRRADWYADDWGILAPDEPTSAVSDGASAADSADPAAANPLGTVEINPEASDPPTTTDPG